MENLSSWQLIEINHFEEACKKADIEYADTKGLPSLRHKVYALLHLHRYEDAHMLAEKIIEINEGRTDVDFIFSGIALWLLGKKKEAIQRWGNTEEAHFKDAAGGIEPQILLYFAGVVTGAGELKINAVKIMKKLLKPKKGAGWPAPLGTYILGDITEESLFSSVVNIPILRERQLCQAHFAQAIKELERGNKAAYLNSLADCVSYGPSSYLEDFYYLAKGELETQ